MTAELLIGSSRHYKSGKNRLSTIHFHSTDKIRNTYGINHNVDEKTGRNRI